MSLPPSEGPRGRAESHAEMYARLHALCDKDLRVTEGTGDELALANVEHDVVFVGDIDRAPLVASERSLSDREDSNEDDIAVEAYSGANAGEDERQQSGAARRDRVESVGPVQSTNAPKVTRQILPQEATLVLRQWFETHSDDPYPSQDEKKELALRTNVRYRELCSFST
jgi:Homeobox KN domain